MATGQSIAFGGVYAIRNLRNQKLYIGSAADFHDRWGYHRCLLNLGTHKNRHLQAAWTKYGADAFIFEIIQAVQHEDDLLVSEQEALDYFRPYDHANGYNNSPTAGRNTGVRYSDEARARLSEAKKNQSAETRQRISESLKGRQFTEEWRAKMSASAKARCTPEVRAAISARNSNPSPETRARKSAAAKNHSPEHRAAFIAAAQNPSAETRAKIGAASSRPETVARCRAISRLGIEAKRRKAAERREQERTEAQAALRERFGGPPCPWVKDEPAASQLTMFDED